MLKRLNFYAEFSDIGLMPVAINTYRSDIKKAIADYVKRMESIGVTVIRTTNAQWV